MSMILSGGNSASSNVTRFTVSPADIPDFKLGDKVVYDRFQDKITTSDKFYASELQIKNFNDLNPKALGLTSLGTLQLGRWHLTFASPTYNTVDAQHEVSVIGYDTLGLKSPIDAKLKCSLLGNTAPYKGIFLDDYKVSPTGNAAIVSFMAATDVAYLVYFTIDGVEDELKVNGLPLVGEVIIPTTYRLGLLSNALNDNQISYSASFIDNDNVLVIYSNSTTIKYLNLNVTTGSVTLGSDITSLSITNYKCNSLNGFTYVSPDVIVIPDGSDLKMVNVATDTLVTSSTISFALENSSSAYNTSVFDLGNNEGLAIVLTNSYVGYVRFSWDSTSITIIEELKDTFSLPYNLKYTAFELSRGKVLIRNNNTATTTGSNALFIANAGEDVKVSVNAGSITSPLASSGSSGLTKISGTTNKFRVSFLRVDRANLVNSKSIVSTSVDLDDYFSLFKIPFEDGEYYKSPTIGRVIKITEGIIEVDSQGYGAVSDVVNNLEPVGKVINKNTVSLGSSSIFSMYKNQDIDFRPIDVETLPLSYKLARNQANLKGVGFYKITTDKVEGTFVSRQQSSTTGSFLFLLLLDNMPYLINLGRNLSSTADFKANYKVDMYTEVADSSEEILLDFIGE